MMPQLFIRHCSTGRIAVQTRKGLQGFYKIRCTLFIVCLIAMQCTYTVSAPAQPLSQEAGIATELKEVSEDFGYVVDVRVVNNRYTGMQDLFVTSSEGHSYETDVFLRTVCAATATVTSQSPTYETFIDMLMIGINDELWAISTASCRKAFGLTTQAKQNALLRSRLQQLK